LVFHAISRNGETALALLEIALEKPVVIRCAPDAATYSGSFYKFRKASAKIHSLHEQMLILLRLVELYEFDICARTRPPVEPLVKGVR
jgi:hypothetical protein